MGSQSLRKSGQFLYDAHRGGIEDCRMSQSLRKSGQFLLSITSSAMAGLRLCRNPFVNQVSFFVSGLYKPLWSPSRNPFVNQVSFFPYMPEFYWLPSSGRNPFVNQVSFFSFMIAELKDYDTSQSLRKSGQFLSLSTWNSRRGKRSLSQSLRKSGQFLWGRL